MKAAVLIIAALLVGFLVLLAVEVVIAHQGERLPEAFYDWDGTRIKDPHALQVVWLGDSTAAGTGATSIQTTVAKQVDKALGNKSSIRNFAISGSKLNDVLKTQVASVPENTDVVFISIGANDTNRFTSLGEFHHRYKELLTKLPSNTKVVLLGVPDMGSAPAVPQPLRWISGWRGRKLDKEVREVARSTNSVYVDIAGYTGEAFRSDPQNYFADDDFHPNDEGYRIWSEAVVKAIQNSDLKPIFER